MGQFQLVYTAIGALVFVAAIIGLRFIIVTNFVNADITSQITSRELNAMSVSYNLLDCFNEGKDSVDAEFLERNKGKNICEGDCKICNLIAEARVTDLESDPEKTWDFKYSVLTGMKQWVQDKFNIWDREDDYNKRQFSVYLNIDYGDDSHVGRLDVNV